MLTTDAMQANLGFVVSQTSHVESGVYALRYPDITYASMIPVDTTAHPWSTSVTYYSSDTVGRANWIAGRGRDVPVVNGTMDKFETSVFMAGIGYEYGIEEVNQARMLGMSLDATYANAARRAYEEMVEAIAYGYSDARVTAKGFQGLFNYTGVPAAAVANDGASSATAWSAKTPDLINRDINALLTGVHTATNTVAMADTLILPVERYQSIASTRLGDTEKTILEFVRKNNVYTAMTGRDLTIRGLRGMTTIGSGSTARMIAYRRSPEVLKLHIPMPHQFLPVQVAGLVYQVPGIFRLGGLDIRLPREVRYADGI